MSEKWPFCIWWPLVGKNSLGPVNSFFFLFYSLGPPIVGLGGELFPLCSFLADSDPFFGTPWSLLGKNILIFRCQVYGSYLVERDVVLFCVPIHAPHLAFGIVSKRIPYTYTLHSISQQNSSIQRARPLLHPALSIQCHVCSLIDPTGELPAHQ